MTVVAGGSSCQAILDHNPETVAEVRTRRTASGKAGLNTARGGLGFSYRDLKISKKSEGSWHSASFLGPFEALGYDFNE